MAFCHGQGGPDQPDGCCYVNGLPCPLRWKIVDGRIYEGPDLTDLGTVVDLVNARWRQKQIREKVLEQVQGITYLCRAALEVVAADPSLILDRVAFEQAWDNHPDYVALVRPAWEAVEDRMGLARGEFQCSSWKGEGNQQCCFSEDTATNESKAGALSTVAVTLRRNVNR
jgi:hypothetical protein